MPYSFFDTSALVKRYYEEDGTDRVDTLVEDPDTTVLITSLSILETVSAFRRKYNSDAITRQDMEALLVAFFREALTDFVILPVDETMYGDAFDLIVDEDLRTLDSLQLAAALTAHGELDPFQFVCADTDLVEVAETHGVQAINPASP